MIFDKGKGRKVKVDTPEGPKIVSLVEGGGVYTCHPHNFSTEDLLKFNMHLKEEGHALAAGSVKNCIMCNKPNVQMEGLAPGVNAVCDECTLKLADQAKAAHSRLAEMRKK